MLNLPPSLQNWFYIHFEHSDTISILIVENLYPSYAIDERPPLVLLVYISLQFWHLVSPITPAEPWNGDIVTVRASLGHERKINE